MCMADYRISRFVTSTYREVNLGASDVVVATANKQRVGIQIFYCPAVDPVTAPNDSAFLAIDTAAQQNISIPLQQNGNQIKFTFAEDGDLPQRSFHVIDLNASTGTACVIEHWLPESILASFLEKP